MQRLVRRLPRLTDCLDDIILYDCPRHVADERFDPQNCTTQQLTETYQFIRNVVYTNVELKPVVHTDYIVRMLNQAT